MTKNEIYRLRIGEKSASGIFAEHSILEDVKMCLETILSTHKYSVPLYRDFGLDLQALDMPTPRAMTLMRSEIYNAVASYEPRAEITAVTYEPAEAGTDDRIRAVVSWRLKAGVTI